MFILQQALVSTLLLSCILTTTQAQNMTAVNQTSTTTSPTNGTSKVLPIITNITEGGGLDVSNSTKAAVEGKLNITRPYGREHEIGKVIEEKVIPISENISESASEKAVHKGIVPKKGVEFPPLPKALNVSSTTTTSTTTTTTTTTSTTTPEPKKPLITEGNSDEPYAPSHFVSSKSKNNVSSVEKVPSIEKQSKNSTDYIVPIVGVILSVPLVAILLNVVYRRSKEWWHHRHYSRMDFLIDGMYNN